MSKFDMSNDTAFSTGNRRRLDEIITAYPHEPKGRRTMSHPEAPDPLPEAYPPGLHAPVDGPFAPPAPPLLPKQPSLFASLPGTLKRAPRMLWIGLGIGFVAGILVSLAVSGIASLAGSLTPSHVITDAVKTCGTAGKAGITVGDNGQRVTIHTQGKTDTSGATLSDLDCMITALKVPDSVVSQMNATTALQGRQTADWDNLDASWSYHPDSGMNLIVKVVNK